MTIAVWFRNDLRVYDNPALYQACRQQDKVIGFYFYTPTQLKRHDVGANKQRFIIESVMALQKDLAKIGIPLLAVRCTTFDNSLDALQAICRQHDISALHFNEEYELNERHRDTQAFQRLQSMNIAVQSHQDQVILAPGEVLTGQGQPFRVYTPFKRSWLKRVGQQSLQPLPAPKRRATLHLQGTNPEEINCWASAQPANRFWHAGSKAAFQRLDQFIEQRIAQYDQTRDLPAADSTSQLSPYLAVGALSVRACFHAALNANRQEWDSGKPGIIAWINELIWREFYKNLTYHFPEVCRGEAFQTQTDGLSWRQDRTHFESWANGYTGYPLVDAAMRQLLTMGWMHNRLRMVTAMFLTKHLFIDWRWGEAFFMQRLIDGDFSANNGGWQWSASTGADAAPYFRVFNPVRQSQRFDPEGRFIRHWLPELATLSATQIHDPSPLERQLCGYPAPIVDHRAAVERVKAEFKQLKLLTLA